MTYQYKITHKYTVKTTVNIRKMITALSRKEIKSQKAQKRRELREMLITIKDVAEAVKGQWHENSVYRAFNPDISYWNPEIMGKAQELIEAKKNPITTNIL